MKFNYYKIIIIAILGVCFTNMADAKTIHTIIFADTNDASIGNGVRVNVNKITAWSNAIGAALKQDGYQTQIYTYTGSLCNKTSLSQFLSSFYCQDDIVIFFYGGHGGRSQYDTSKFPKMCLGSNSESQFMSLTELQSTIESKNPQLLLIIADCCNSYYDGYVPQCRMYAMGASNQTTQYSTAFCRELFSKHGVIISTGASKGEYGWVNRDNGGFFTTSFLESFDFSNARSQDKPSWNTIFADTKDQTYELSQRAYLLRCITKIQTPVYDIKVSNDNPRQKQQLTRVNFGNGYYLGQVVNGKKQGIGSYFFNDGSRFEGEYSNDKINGSGIYYWNTNHYTAGTWVNGKRTGYAIEVYENGTYACEYWENEIYIPSGPQYNNPKRLNYSNGYYWGEVSNGVAHGKGKYYWNDGSVFEGTWVNGVINGSGLLKFANNTGYYVGYWKNGARTCYGLQCLNSGYKLIGYWENEVYRAKSFIIYQQ